MRGMRILVMFSWILSGKCKRKLTLQAIVEECQGVLDAFDGISSVHSRFYELSSNYHKLMGNHADYYKDALRFLGCMSLDDIPGKVPKIDWDE